MFIFIFTVHLVLLFLNTEVSLLPTTACYAPFKWQDCGKPPTSVMYYWKPGSRCEVGIWRGCLPNLNMFKDEYECVTTCIFSVRAGEEDYHKLNQLSGEIDYEEEEYPTESQDNVTDSAENDTDTNINEPDTSENSTGGGANGTDQKGESNATDELNTQNASTSDVNASMQNETKKPENGKPAIGKAGPPV